MLHRPSTSPPGNRRSVHQDGAGTFSLVEERLFKTQQIETRSNIAQTLRTVADQIERGTVHLQDGDRAQTVTLPEEPTLEIELETQRDERTEETTFELESELSWTR